LVNLLMLKRAV